MKTEHKTILALAATVAVLSASAETIVWTGAAGDYSWDTSENWNPAKVPTSADDVWLGTSSYTAGVYAQPIVLGSGVAACNSLNFYQNAAITVGAVGEKLTITSGSVTLNNNGLSQDYEYVLKCDIDLENETKENVWDLRRNTVSHTKPKCHLLVNGKVSANGGEGSLNFKSSNPSRMGAVAFTSTVASKGDIELNNCYLELCKTSVEDVFGEGRTLKLKGSGGGVAMFLDGDFEFSTPIDASSATGTFSIIPYGGTLTFKTPVVVPQGLELCLGSTNAGFIDLRSSISGQGRLAVMRTCVFVHSADDLPSSVRMYGTGGGFAIDRDSMTSESFFSHFSNGGATSSIGAGQWGCWGKGDTPGGGFGAHGAPFVIPNTEGSKDWFGGQSALQLGVMANAVAAAKAVMDSPVILETGIALTKAFQLQSGIGVVSLPIYRRPVDRAMINEIRGDITGSGALALVGASNDAYFDEIYLSGESSWSGASGQSGLKRWLSNEAKDVAVRVGKGGMISYASNGGVSAVVFGSQASIPHGNNGGTAYLLAASRYVGRPGYLVDGSPSGSLYALPSGVMFLLNQNCTARPEFPFLGALVKAGESAALSGDVLINRMKEGSVGFVTLAPVGEGEFHLGTATAPLSFAKVIGSESDNTAGGLDASASVMSDEKDGTVALYVTGGGTVVLDNVAYTDLAHSVDKSAQYRWYIGEDRSSLDSNHPYMAEGYNSPVMKSRDAAVFRGAVRTTAAGQPGSILCFPLVGLGGSLELEDIDVQLTTTETPEQGGEIRMRGGFGFAAHGTRDSTVTLNGGDELKVGNGANGNPTDGFPHSSAGLIFGSRTANRTVLFKNDINCCNRNVSLYAVGGTEPEKPVVRLDGKIYNGSLIVKGMMFDDGKTHLPCSIVELTNAESVLTGLSVQNGTALVSCEMASTGNNASFAAEGGELRVTGSLPYMGGHVKAGKSGDATVGGVLSGTGQIDSHVIIYGGAGLRPGVKGTGSLTLKRNLQFYNDAKLVLGAAQPTVHAGGNMYIANRATVVLDGDIEGKRAILSWDGSLSYVDGGSAATSDCSQWTVSGVAKPQNYSFEVDTANKCIWLKNNKPGLILIVR